MKQIYTIDLSQDKSRENSYLSETLLSKIKDTLEKKEKVLLYLNKRGSFSSYICKDCNHIRTCPNCDLSLSIHAHPDRCICHHCFYEESLKNTCPECAGVELQKIGVGTMQIQESIMSLFPHAQVCRFDTDSLQTVSAKKDAVTMLDTADIIIGTKMITTGFNIQNLGLIGVILIEQELNIPRYNTEENVYSNIRQLLWRWGRVWQKTDVVLQSYAVKNKAIRNITEKNYKDFFLSQLSERKIFSYPPYGDLAYLIYKHKDKQSSLAFMKKMYDFLNERQDETVQLTLVDKAIKRNNQYFSKIVLKWENLRNFIEPLRKEILQNSDFNVNFES